MKVLLILVDGMRPDAIKYHPTAQKYMARSACTLKGRTVMPSVTLPCHMSLFHSVLPERHGTTTNIYTPPARPVNGLCEVLKMNGKRSAFFYNWEELRDLARPGSLDRSCYLKGGNAENYEKTNKILTDEAIKYINDEQPDFVFHYLGHTDEVGHRFGWMSEEYYDAVDKSWENIDRLVAALPEGYTVIITADHGGHGRTHGTDADEDMLIPLMIMGKNICPGQLENVSIMDIAPTVVKIMGLSPDADWEGKSLI